MRKISRAEIVRAFVIVLSLGVPTLVAVVAAEYDTGTRIGVFAAACLVFGGSGLLVLRRMRDD